MKQTLTGRKRYRREYLGPGRHCMVLQVEFSEFNMVSEAKPGRWVCSWRDATENDIVEGDFHASAV